MQFLKKLRVPGINTLTLTKIALDQQNRMIRAGFGKHDGKWFFRIDIWVAGFRLSR